MRVAVFGAGGVGGYLAAHLGRWGVADVALIARGTHLEALRRDGLRLRSPRGDVHVRLPATDDPAVIGPVDAVLFTVKTPDTDAAAADLAPLVAEDTSVISFQNGVGNEDRLAGQIGAGHVLGGAAFIFCAVRAPGLVEHTGGPGRFVLGELDGRRTARAQGLVATLRAANVRAELADDIRGVLWRKLAFICAQAGTTAATRLPIGVVRADPPARALFRDLVEEVVAVAAAERVTLPPETVDEAMELADALPEEATSSLLHDLERGRPLELAALHGHVVEAAARHVLQVPATRVVHALLSPWAAGEPRGARSS